MTLVPRRMVRVVAALISGPAPGSFLVQQRLPNTSRANLWEFPGGKVEAGETEPEALVRECLEELGVRVEVAERVWHTVHDYEDFSVDLALHRARIVEGEAQSLGAQAIRFCTAQEMQSLPFCEADLPLLKALALG